MNKDFVTKPLIQVWLKDHEIVDRDGKPEPIYVDTSRFVEKPCVRCGETIPHYQIVVRGKDVGEHVFPHKHKDNGPVQ